MTGWLSGSKLETDRTAKMIGLLGVLCVMASRTSYALNLGCQQVQYAYSDKGFSDVEIPAVPQSGDALQICPQGPTCCTKDLEQKLGDWSVAQYRQALEERSSEIARPLRQKALELGEFMDRLLGDSRRQFHDIFTRTYGRLYEENVEVFNEYFEQLEEYYRYGKVNLPDANDNFFAQLFYRMFKVMNSQYTFDAQYMGCVTEHMHKFRPFGDVPRQMATAVKRSMVATRVLIKALKSGFDIIQLIKEVRPTRECSKAVQKMNSCPACQGLPELKPCNKYCLNVMNGCLAFHIELQDLWDKFLDATTNLTDRLSGPFNVQMVIFPLDIKISDAIMNFQESGFKITQDVFSLCGKPRVLKRDTGFTFDKPLKKLGELKPTKGSSSRFEQLINDLRTSLRPIHGFWKSLPSELCRTDADQDQCWNGRANGPYAIDDPEVPATATPSVFNEQKFRLQSLLNQLRLAHRGQDIMWWDDDDTEDFEGSGSGDEGSGEMEDEEGSGEEIDTTTEAETTTEQTVSVASGRIRLDLVSAVVTFLVPVSVCWFSNAVRGL